MVGLHGRLIRIYISFGIRIQFIFWSELYQAVNVKEGPQSPKNMKSHMFFRDILNLKCTNYLTCGLNPYLTKQHIKNSNEPL